MHNEIQILIGGILKGSIYAIVALGFALVYRVAGTINLAQGAFCVVGALCMHSYQSAGLPLALAFPLAVLTTTAFAAIVGATIFVPSLTRLANSSMLMLSAGLLTMIAGMNLLIWGNAPYALGQFSGEAPIEIFGISFVTQGFWILLTTLIVPAGLWYMLFRTELGIALRACSENPLAARLMGIKVREMALLSFCLAAMIGAVGGIMVAPLITLAFDTGGVLTFSGVIAATIGGMESLIGAVVGGLVLGISEQFAAGYISTMFSQCLSLCLLFAVLLWRPTGLFPPRVTRREDVVREEHRIHRALIRFTSRQSIIVGAAVIAVVAVLPIAFAGSGILQSLIIAEILFIAVLGLDVAMGYAGLVNLGQAAFMALGGYTAAILATEYGVTPWLGTLAGMTLSAAIGSLLAFVTRHLRGMYLALATLTFGLVIDSLAVGLRNVTGGPAGISDIPSFFTGCAACESPLATYYLIGGIALLSVLLLSGAMRSNFGRTLLAIRSDQTAAAALGVNVARYKVAALAISSAFGSLAGSLYAFHFHYLSPDMVSSMRSIELLAMLVIGGEGMLLGALIGVLLLTLLPALFQPLAAYMPLAQGAVLVFAFRYLPNGIFGSLCLWIFRSSGRSVAGARDAAAAT